MSSTSLDKNLSPIDRLILEFDTALRAIAGGANYVRPIPKNQTKIDLKKSKHLLQKLS